MAKDRPIEVELVPATPDREREVRLLRELLAAARAAQAANGAVSVLRDELSEMANRRAVGKSQNKPYGHYNSLEDLVLAEGDHQVGSKKWFPRCGWKMGPPKRCYRNSYRIVAKNPVRYMYCEGWVRCGSGFVVEHAWVRDQDGLVIDPTLSDGQEYLGLCFKFDVVRATIAREGRYGLCGSADLLRLLLTDPEFRSKSLLLSPTP